jgi:hypothetical protein
MPKLLVQWFQVDFGQLVLKRGLKKEAGTEETESGPVWLIAGVLDVHLAIAALFDGTKIGHRIHLPLLQRRNTEYPGTGSNGSNRRSLAIDGVSEETGGAESHLGSGNCLLCFCIDDNASNTRTKDCTIRNQNAAGTHQDQKEGTQQASKTSHNFHL